MGEPSTYKADCLHDGVEGACKRGFLNGTVYTVIHQATARMAIYRKLKGLGYSDEKIFDLYEKSRREI